ncbi:MAG: DUF4383 domain-containing protein [Armatimonadota bacterium]|nr:DUF4383 domain-containing protein [Armatimonadota bacterium]
MTVPGCPPQRRARQRSSLAFRYDLGAGLTLLALGVAGFLLPAASRAVGLSPRGLRSAVHLASGLALTLAASTGAAQLAAQISGIVYTAAAVLGFVDRTTVLHLFPVNDACNVVHLAIGVLGQWAGFRRETRDP